MTYEHFGKWIFLFRGGNLDLNIWAMVESLVMKHFDRTCSCFWRLVRNSCVSNRLFSLSIQKQKDPICTFELNV